MPFHPLHDILGHALAPEVADAQIELSSGEILLRGFAIPLHSLDLIFRHAFAIVVADAQIELSVGEILLRGFAIPLYRFGVILRHALAAPVAEAQIILSLGVILLGCLRQDLTSDIYQRINVKRHFEHGIGSGFSTCLCVLLNVLSDSGENECHVPIASDPPNRKHSADPGIALRRDGLIGEQKVRSQKAEVEGFSARLFDKTGEAGLGVNLHGSPSHGSQNVETHLLPL